MPKAKKRGRPVKPKGQRVKSDRRVLALSLPMPLWERLQVVAADEDRPVSSWLRVLAEKELKRIEQQSDAA